MSANHIDPSTRLGRWRLPAVVATIVLLTLLATFLLGVRPQDGPGRSTGVAPEVTSEPKDHPSSPPTRPDGFAGSFDLLRGVTDGEPLSVPYLVGTKLVIPPGTSMALQRRYDGFALLGDRVVASYDDQGDRVLDVLTGTGGRIDSSSLVADFAVADAGNVVAWATAQGEVVTAWSAGRLSFGNQGGPVMVEALIGHAPCRESDNGCRVYVNNVDGRPPQSVTSDGSVTAIAPGAIKVNDVRADGLVAVQLSSSDTGSCSGAYDEREHTYLWRTCRHSLLQFSPEGGYLLASHPYLDGLGLGSLSVLDARTGRELVKFTVRGGFIAQYTWEDASHPLIVLSSDRGWEVLRLDLDGSRERALGPVAPAADPTRPPIVLGHS